MIIYHLFFLQEHQHIDRHISTFCVQNHPPLADELQVSDTESVIPVKELMMLNRQPLADDLDWHDFFSVRFTHHCEILAKTDTLEERAFYIHHDADKTNDDKEG